MAYFVSTPPVIGAPGEIHTSPKNPLGAKARDNEGRTFVYLKGVASGAEADVLVIGPALSVIRANVDHVGAVAVAVAAANATSYTWYGTDGTFTVKAAASGTNGAKVYASATAGTLTHTAVTGKQITGAVLRSDEAEGKALVELRNAWLGTADADTI